MLVVVALRWTDPRASVDPLSGEVRTDPRGSGASAADRAALEHALRLGGRCVAVTVGPPDADDMLREALAVGADEVLRVEGATTVAEDGSGTARLLLDGIITRHGRPDLVLCGDHSADRGTGSTPAFLAHLLGACQALGLLELTVSNFASAGSVLRDTRTRGASAGVDGQLHALRRLDGGRRERLTFGLPAVCSVEPADVRLRRASLPSVLAARTAKIPVVRGGSVTDARIRVGESRPYRPRPRALPAPAGTAPHQRMLALTGALVERTPPRVVTPATAAEAAEELLGHLREHGYLA